MTLNAYSASTGQKLRTLNMASRFLNDMETEDGVTTQITRVGGEWVLFEELDDPRSKENRCIKQLIAYRISDFKKAAEPITFKWNCFNKPVVNNGRLIIPFKDHLLWTELSTIVRFEDVEDGAEDAFTPGYSSHVQDSQASGSKATLPSSR